MPSLNKLKSVRRIFVDVKRFYLNRLWGMDIHPTAEFSLSVRFDKTFPAGMHVGAESYIAFDVAILAHDTTRRLYRHTYIGKRCFIGARSVILPGIEIGDGSIVAAGSVVTKNVPPGSVVAGNPATVVRSGIEVEAYGRFVQHRSVSHEQSVSY